MLSDFQEEHLALNGDYLWQVVEIVIGGGPTVLVHMSQENTVGSLHIDESVLPSETSSGSSEC